MIELTEKDVDVVAEISEKINNLRFDTPASKKITFSAEEWLLMNTVGNYLRESIVRDKMVKDLFSLLNSLKKLSNSDGHSGLIEDVSE